MSGFIFKQAENMLLIGGVDWLRNNIKAMLVTKLPCITDDLEKIKKYKSGKSVKLHNKSVKYTEFTHTNMTVDADDITFPPFKSKSPIVGIVLYDKDLHIPIAYIGNINFYPIGGNITINFNNGDNKIFTTRVI